MNTGRGKGRNNDKSARFCDYCNTPRHVKGMCFQLKGYLEWYQQLKGMKESANMAKLDINKTPLDFSEDPTAKLASVTSMSRGLQQELDKIKERM